MELEQTLETNLEAIQSDKEALRMMITSAGRYLHPNHSLMVAAKRYLLYQLEAGDPERMALAQEILAILDVLTPGLTKERGLTLFEIHHGKLRKLKSDLEMPISNDEAKQMQSRLEEIMHLGLAARQCLQFESPHTFEGRILRTLEMGTLKLTSNLQGAIDAALKGCVT